MPKWPSIFVVAIVAILLTLLGSSLAAGGGDSGGPQPLPCGITVENPCPPLLQGNRAQLTAKDDPNQG